MAKTNIVLIGFMGTGKTAVGQALASKLNMTLVETDAIIEHRAGKKIPEIFGKDGEIAFRELEIEAVKQASQGWRQVIACGGGVVLNTINIERLRETGVNVLLTAAPEVILGRTSANLATRPLLAGVADPATRIHDLLRLRRPFYRLAADITVSTSRLSVTRVTDLIIRKLKDHASLDLEE